MIKEKILCAAIHYLDYPIEYPYKVKNISRGTVLCGHRHSHIIGQCVSLIGKKQHEMGQSVQGFLTSGNRFLNREEAAIVHVENGGKLNYSTYELFSEDLY